MQMCECGHLESSHTPINNPKLVLEDFTHLCQHTLKDLYLGPHNTPRPEFYVCKCTKFEPTLESFIEEVREESRKLEGN